MSASPPHQRPPLFALLFIAMFGFIGLTVIIALWTADGFGDPPLVFKLFGSFIGLAFMCVGFGVPIRALFGSRDTGAEQPPRGRASGGGYKCPNCGAGLGSQEVSPAGDVKCSYCDKWFNIHARP